MTSDSFSALTALPSGRAKPALRLSSPIPLSYSSWARTGWASKRSPIRSPPVEVRFIRSLGGAQGPGRDGRTRGRFSAKAYPGGLGYALFAPRRRPTGEGHRRSVVAGVAAPPTRGV